MNEQKNNGRGIFYGVIGVATLVVAIIGATFAYFTASASNENRITGNMASISIGLDVVKMTTAGDVAGLIPMSNSMVEVAVNTELEDRGDSAICIDDNGNAVCQVYKATVTNNSAAAVFVDGFVALKGGSGAPTDYTYTNVTAPAVGTTMRWAQVFCSESGNTVSSCTTVQEDVGTTILRSTTDTIDFASLDASGVDPEDTLEEKNAKAKNTANIRDGYNTFVTTTGANFTTTGGLAVSLGTGKGVLVKAQFAGNDYAVIGTNYIRVSDHSWDTASATTISADEVYTQEDDVTSALVFNQSLTSNTDTDKNKQTYYFVVWLTETGTNQTAGSNGTNAATSNNNFFQGQVKFLSAQGSEVSATFGGYTRVPATDNGVNANAGSGNQGGGSDNGEQTG